MCDLIESSLIKGILCIIWFTLCNCYTKAIENKIKYGGGGFSISFFLLRVISSCARDNSVDLVSCLAEECISRPGLRYYMKPSSRPDLVHVFKDYTLTENCMCSI